MKPVLLLIALCAILVSPLHAASYDEDVFQAQRALNARGYDPGVADGLMGGKTRRAIQDFQRSLGLTPSGELDTETLVGLGIREPVPPPIQPTRPTPEPAREPERPATPERTAAPAPVPTADSAPPERVVASPPASRTPVRRADTQGRSSQARSMPFDRCQAEAARVIQGLGVERSRVTPLVETSTTTITRVCTDKERVLVMCDGSEGLVVTRTPYSGDPTAVSTDPCASFRVSAAK